MGVVVTVAKNGHGRCVAGSQQEQIDEAPLLGQPHLVRGRIPIVREVQDLRLRITVFVRWAMMSEVENGMYVFPSHG
jgi:hypothetical protein